MIQTTKKDILIFVFISSFVSILFFLVFSYHEEKTVIANQLVQMGYFEEIKDLKTIKTFTENESDLIEALQRKDFLNTEQRLRFESLEKTDPVLKLYAKNLYDGKVDIFVVNKTGENLDEITSAIVEYIKKRHQKNKDNLKKINQKSLIYKDAVAIGQTKHTKRTTKPHVSMFIIAGILVSINFIFFNKLRS